MYIIFEISGPRPMKEFTPPPEGESEEETDSEDEYTDDSEYSDEDEEEEETDDEGTKVPKYRDEFLEMVSLSHLVMLL